MFKFRGVVFILILLFIAACGGGGGNPVEDLSSSITTSIPVDNGAIGSDGSIPADPGAAADLTLLGVDTNDNSVRDEVEIAIADRYPEDIQTKNALKQVAKSIQSAFEGIDTSDTEATSAAVSEMIKAVDCLTSRSDDPRSDLLFIEMQMVDTTARAQAYNAFNESAAGQFF
ncbi:MAG: hypothetical protein C0603_11910 [Denitrovibrio sp.]|nr:MAG: hypothetical protein C0603_11910 [Denitrovibrio sp.]